MLADIWENYFQNISNPVLLNNPVVVFHPEVTSPKWPSVSRAKAKSFIYN